MTISPAEAVNNIKADLVKRDLMVVVGSGVTAAATNGASQATWKGLILDGIKRIETSGARDADWSARARADVESPYGEDLVVAAEKVTSGLGGIVSPQYSTWLRETVGSLTIRAPQVPKALAKLAACPWPWKSPR